MYFQNALQNNLTQRMGRADSINPASRKLFSRALRAGKMGKRNTANALPNIARESHTAHRHLGVQTIAIDTIGGSVNKSADFDNNFNPLSDHIEARWVKVATAMMHGIDLPPLDLIVANGTYYVVDGHHRISVAKQLGITYLDAIVTAWE